MGEMSMVEREERREEEATGVGKSGSAQLEGKG